MGAGVGPGERDAARGEHGDHPCLHRIRLGLRDRAAPEAGLVRDDHELPRALQRAQGVDGAGERLHEGGVARIAHVDDQRAVAIQEQRPRHERSLASVSVVERPGTSGTNSTRPP